jgi:diguanylate cyclase (GGDEF)-like protein
MGSLLDQESQMSTFPSLRRQTASAPHSFRPDVFIVATIVAAAILVSIVAIPQWLSRQARWELLRSHVGQIGQLAASAVDGDLHRRLLDPSAYSAELYATAVRPLVRFHSANSELFYVYTMARRDDGLHFILDTAGSPDLRTKHHLRASEYMQRFNLHQEYDDGWLDQIATGNTYVTPTYEHDDYGYFLTAHVPIYDSQNRYSGFVGVDFDMGYYLAQEKRFRMLEVGSLVVAVMAALLIGYLLTLYYGDLQQRLRQLYRRATHDDLTGLLNRRGAEDAVHKALMRHPAKCTMMLIAIDHLKLIVSFHGHSNSDVVIASTADAIRQSISDGEVCARLAEDEFMIFSTEGGVARARDTVNRTLAQLSHRERMFAGAKLTVSIGIAEHDGADTDFSRMYEDANAVLNQARVEYNGGMTVLTSSSGKNETMTGMSALTPHDLPV